MRNSFAAMRRLIAVSAIMAVPVMSVGCNDCKTAATTTCAKPVAVKPASPCAAPVVQVQPVVYRQTAPVVYTAATPAYNSGPICGGDVALDGSVIRNGQIVYDGTAATRAAYGAPYAPLYATTYMEYYNKEAASAKPAVAVKKGKRAAARKSALPGGTGEAVRVGKPVREPGKKLIKPSVRTAPKAVAAPVAAAPAAPAAVVVQPESTLIPNAVGAQDVTALATVSDVYTVDPTHTYTVTPAPTPAAVVSPVSPVTVAAPQQLAPVVQQQQMVSASSVRVLGPSTLGLSEAEIDNYSKTDVYEAPPQPAPVPPPVVPGAGTCAPEVVQQGLCPNLY